MNFLNMLADVLHKHFLGIVFTAVILSNGNVVCAGDYTAHVWEHGYQTSFVSATRYKNDETGSFTIGLRYFGSVDFKADRAEVFAFLRKNGCSLWQGGGEPFSEYIISCKDVNDKESANKKLLKLLPKLSKFIDKL